MREPSCPDTGTTEPDGLYLHQRAYAALVVFSDGGDALRRIVRIPLSRQEYFILGSLLASFGQTVSRIDLRRAAVGLDVKDSEQIGRAVDVRICGLRRLLAPHGYAIASVRGHGYMLLRASLQPVEKAPDTSAPPEQATRVAS